MLELRFLGSTPLEACTISTIDLLHDPAYSTKIPEKDYIDPVINAGQDILFVGHIIYMIGLEYPAHHSRIP